MELCGVPGNISLMCNCRRLLLAIYYSAVKLTVGSIPEDLSTVMCHFADFDILYFCIGRTILSCSKSKVYLLALLIDIFKHRLPAVNVFYNHIKDVFSPLFKPLENHPVQYIR